MTCSSFNRCIGWLVLLGLLAGCGSDRSPLGQITGLVTYQGEPVEKATIVFHNPQGRSAIGQVVDGSIENVTTYDRINDGAAIGMLKVTVHPAVEMELSQTPAPGEEAKVPAKPPFPQRYSDPEQSDLIAEIQPGANEVLFDLTD